MRTFFNTLIAFLGALMLFSACENAVNPTPLGPFPQPTVMLSGVGGCELHEEALLAGDRGEESISVDSLNNDDLIISPLVDGALSGDQLEAVVADGKVTFTHSGATYNCCLDSIGLEMEREGLLFRILETEYAPEPCLCTCDYTVDGEIVDLTAGDYTIEVVNAADPTKVLCSATITVM